MKEALLYQKLENNSVECYLCHRRCIIRPNAFGLCRVRKNIGGTLYALTYKKPIAVNYDPIEKKPFYHFKPFSFAFSIATQGCNFFCKHCQNYEISQSQFNDSKEIPLEDIIEKAKEYHADSIAYTYTEPTVFLEYALDLMKLAKKSGLSNIWVSNGYFTEDAFNLFSPYLDAINIDYKGDAKFYKEICGNVSLNHIQENISLIFSKKIHLEITNLLIPNLNTKENQIKEMVDFISSLSPDIPLHLTKFFPSYALSHLPATDISFLEKAKQIAEKKLNFVYLGNTKKEENTYCPKCHSLLIDRENAKSFLKENKCPFCSYPLPSFVL